MNQTPIGGEAGKVKRFGRDVLQAALAMKRRSSARLMKRLSEEEIAANG
jgi:hypothetical protein